MLETLQRDTFEYFIRQTDPRTGLVGDRNEAGAPSSIAATGLGLTTYCVAAERAWLQRSEAIARTLMILRFFYGSAQGPEANATGYHGLYYHFLDMRTGRRVWQCELSTIDTALLIAGALTAASYFERESSEEREIRELADLLYRRVDWRWISNRAGALRNGWTPEHGFLRWSWDRGYSEAMLLYVLALGSPTFPISEGAYRAWTATFERKTLYDLDCIYAGPLFIHQLPQAWLDLRGIRDDRTREVGFDYFENSQRATLVHQRYAIENPHGFAHYSDCDWGFTASDGPGPAVRIVDGVRRTFYGYMARGAPFGPDDGTLAPWAVVASLPFTPEIVCQTIRHAEERLSPHRKHRGGFDASFNPTASWVARWRLGLNEGPIVLMIENCLSELVWDVFMRSPPVATGLRRAGFRADASAVSV
jgi:hypothetical protein